MIKKNKIKFKKKTYELKSINQLRCKSSTSLNLIILFISEIISYLIKIMQLFLYEIFKKKTP